MINKGFRKRQIADILRETNNPAIVQDVIGTEFASELTHPIRESVVRHSVDGKTWNEGEDTE